MKTIKYIWKSSVLKLFNSKMGTFLLVMFVTFWTYNKPLWICTYRYRYPITWCLFPFIMCDVGVLILFWFGVIYINSDIPFMQHVNMYHIMRTGRRKWTIGQIGGIMVRAFVITISMVFLAVLRLANRIDLSNEWGKLAHTLALSMATEQYDLKYVFYYEIFDKYTPIMLMCITILLYTLLISFLGIFMFLVCLYTNKIVAVSLTSAWAVMMFFVMNLHPMIKKKLAYFVPTIWGCFAKSETRDYGYYWLPSKIYMFAFLMIGIAVMTGISIYRVRQIEFNWENTDI